MDSLILNQSLETYGQSIVATCQLSSLTSEALSLLKKGWSHIVVLNQEQQPQGLFSARSLLNWQSSSDVHVFTAPSVTLDDVDLEPLPAIAMTMTVADLLERISQYRHSADNWALVDERGNFKGILEISSLLRSLLQVAINQSPSVLTLLLPLIDQFPLPVMLRDDEGKIVGMNAAWRNSLHTSLTNNPLNIAEPATEIIPKDMTEDAAHLIAPKLPITHQFCTTDESFTWQVVNVALDGSLQGLELAIAYDITAQKSLAQELSGLSRVKDEFLNCINHELKTPLTSVIGIASLLSNSTFGELNDRQSRYVKMIHQSGRQLVSIIDNIFDLAKAESGQLELYTETVSVKEACQKSIQLVKKLVQQDSTIFRNYTFEEGWQLNIQLDIDPTVKTIVADEIRLQQMLVNLLSNAFKFSFFPSEIVNDLPPIPPQIGIKVRWWEGWLALTVWDQGIGIPEEKQCLIFQKFQQVENMLTRRFEGTGASLLLTRHLARLHGGDITFVSQVDVGSQFTILLPPEPNSPAMPFKQIDVKQIDLKQIDLKQVDSSRQNISLSQSRLVLVVETSSEAVELLRNNLTELDYQVVIARSGTEALEKARRLQPCLILLSPDVPMLSGWDVLALLKGDSITQHIKVVMMKRADEPKIHVHQADGILLKPITTEELSKFLLHHTSIPKSFKIIYLNQNIAEPYIHLLQELGHSLIEADSLQQGEVLTNICQPDLFLLDGDSQLLLEHLEQINELKRISDLPILIITKSVIAEINWLQSRFNKLSLHDCVGLDLITSDRATVLLTLHQSIMTIISRTTQLSS